MLANSDESIKESMEWIGTFFESVPTSYGLFEDSNRLKALGDLAFTRLFKITGNHDVLSEKIHNLKNVQPTKQQLLKMATEVKVTPSNVYLLSQLRSTSTACERKFQSRLTNVIDNRVTNRRDYTLTEQMEYLAYRFLRTSNEQQNLHELFVEVQKSTTIFSYTTRFQCYGLTHRLFYLSRLNRVPLDRVLSAFEVNQARYTVASLLWKVLLEGDLDLAIELMICHLLLNPQQEWKDVEPYHDFVQRLYQVQIMRQIHQHPSQDQGFKIYHTVLAYSILRGLAYADAIKDYR